MKVLITGGGTGGHIYPALAIARKIKEESNSVDILYVGTKTGMEADIVPKEGFNFKTIRVKGFRRKLCLDTFKSIKELFLGLEDARKIINEFSPDIVIGTGGYVCGPVVLIASLKGIKTMIHEQNALPGITNRILSRFVDRIAVSFEESKKYFKNSSKVIITGNPIRESFLNINKQDAYKELNLDMNKDFILSFGGSGGQKSLNKAILEVIEKNSKNISIQLIHVTGKSHYDSFMNMINERKINLNKNIKIIPYLYDMPQGLKAADLVITSAGAITIAEVTAVGVPTILIPKSYTAENHQEYNARALERIGASVVLLEKELKDGKLNKVMNELLHNKKTLNKMSKKSKEIGITDSADKIFKIVNLLV